MTYFAFDYLIILWFALRYQYNLIINIIVIYNSYKNKIKPKPEFNLIQLGK